MTSATAEQREAKSQQHDDEKTLKHVLDFLLVLTEDHPVRKAVDALGTCNINDLTSLSPQDIRTLHYKDTEGNIAPIPVHMLLGYFSHSNV